MSQPLTEILNDLICDKPEVMLDALGIEDYVINGRLSIACPIHSGDNPNGLTLYFNEYRGYKGRFICHTHGCEKTFKKSLLGFCRGVLSAQKCGWSRPGDKIYSWYKTLNFLKDLYKVEGDIKSNTNVELNKFVQCCRPDDKPSSTRFIMTRDFYLNSNTSPSQYFIDKGFSPEILKEYDVFSCSNENKPFYKRSMVPVYADDYKTIIGISARSEIGEEPRWTYTKKFPSAINLYPLWKSKEYIKKQRTCIIVESPKSVWKLNMAGINNCVAIWSAMAWNDHKRYLLDQLGVMKLVVILDNDEAGQAGRQKIIEEAGRLYNIVNLRIPLEYNDVADMNVEQVKELLNAIK